jgi:AcrR family transcriptional regulator
MVSHVKRRSYDNAVRAERSAHTRRRILDAARELLLTKGYRATTIAAIARQAAVHVDTVYELVGRKPHIVRTLVEAAISGTDDAVAAEERDYVRRIRSIDDPRQKLAIYASAVRTLQPRMAPLFAALRDASATEAEAAAIWHEISERRAANMRTFAAELDRVDGLRAELSIADAGDVVWALNSPEMYLLLTRDRGWSPEQYELWLYDSWCRLLLPA